MKNPRFAVCFSLFAFTSLATGADWLTDGGDSRRNNWQKDEKILTTANVNGMKLLWKMQAR